MFSLTRILRYMQTNGPIQDYSEFVKAGVSQRFRPQSAAEISDQAAYIYRKHFSTIATACLVPSVYVSGFLVVLVNILLPRLTETRFEGNENLQIAEFALLSIVGMVVGFFMLALGYSKIFGVSYVIAAGDYTGNKFNLRDVESINSLNQGDAFRTILWGLWYVCSPMLLLFAPLLLLALLPLPASFSGGVSTLLVIGGVILVPTALIWSISRANVGFGSIAAGIFEHLRGKSLIERAKQLYARTAIYRRTESISSALVSTALIYIVLRLGYWAVLSIFNVSQWINNLTDNPFIRVWADVVISILPEFLACWLLTPYIAITFALDYYQRRINIEGLDIQALYEQLPQNQR